MDLTRFLRMGQEANPDEKLSAAKGTRQYMYKANPLLEKGRTTRAVTRDQSRKDKRHHQLVTGRGVSPSSIDSEDEEGIAEETHQVQEKTTARQPDRPVRSTAATERMKRLVEYQQKRKKQQAEDTKNKKPPFKVGTYKLDSKTTPLKSGGFHLNASKLSIQNASTTSKALFKFTATSSAKCNIPSTAILERRTPAPLAAKSGSKALKSATNTIKPGPKKKGKKIDSKTVQDLSQDKKSEQSSSSLEAQSTDSASQDTKISADSVEDIKNECQPHDETSVESTQKTEVLTPAISSCFSQIRLTEDSSETQGSPMQEQCAVPVSTPEVAEFKSAGLMTPVSRIRGRSVQRKRQLESSLLKEVLRPDIRADRGSSSTDCKRRHLGRSISRTPAEILGLEDLFDAIDSGSPMSVLLQKSKSMSEEEDIITIPKPKKLDAAFAEISNSYESSDDTSDEPIKDVHYFREALTKETDFLENQCVKWDNKIDEKTMSEDTLGRIRTAVGLARLGMDRKGRFKQFEGLIDDCEFERGERKTTCQDLQGFWDMISGQIEDAKMKFLDLEKLEANGWILPMEEKKVAKKRTVIPVSKPKARAAQSGIRAVIEARRKAMAGKSESPEEENKSTTSVPDSLVETKSNGSFIGFNTPEKINPLIKRKSLLHSGCTSKTSSPMTMNFRGITPNTPSSVKIGKPANRRLSALIMLSTRHLRKSDYFGDMEQSPVKTALVDSKNDEDVIKETIQESEASRPSNMDARDQVEVLTSTQTGGSTETPRSGGRKGRKSLAPKPSFESQHSEPEPSSRTLRSKKSRASQNYGIDVGTPEKDQGLKPKRLKRTQREDETNSIGINESTDTAPKIDDLMDVVQTPSRRTRKSVAFKIFEEPLPSTEKMSHKRRQSLAIELSPDVGNHTPSQTKRGRKSVVPEQHLGDISFTPKKMKRVNCNSPLHVTFEEAKENYPEPVDASHEKKRKRGRPSHVLPTKESQSLFDSPSRSRRSMRASMVSNLISFESPVARHASILKSQTGLSEPAPQRLSRKSVAPGSVQFNLMD